MENKKNKYEGLAVASFVLSLIPLIVFLILMGGYGGSDMASVGVFMGVLLYSLICYPLAIIFGVIALKRIKKNQRKGKVFAILGIILSVLPVLFLLIINLVNLVRAGGVA